MREIVITVNRDGTLRAVVSDETLRISEAVGATKTVRASNVVPVNLIKFVSFVALRMMFGARGRVAEWTRRWQGPWEVWLAGDKSKRPAFTHQSRRVCIDWEIAHLNQRHMQS